MLYGVVKVWYVGKTVSNFIIKEFVALDQYTEGWDCFSLAILLSIPNVVSRSSRRISNMKAIFQ